MKRLWNRFSLNKKIILIIVLTTFAATVTVIPAIFFTIRDGMLRQQQEYLTGIKNLVEGLLNDKHRAIRNYAVLFSTDKEVKDNLYYHTELAGERIHPLNAIRHLVESFDVRFIELCNSEGRLVANTEEPDMYDLDRSGDPLVRLALDGNVATGIERKEKGFVLLAVSPIYYDQNQLIGTISTGVIMDDTFTERIRMLSGVELAIVDGNGDIAASTIHSLEHGALIKNGGDAVEISGKRYLLIRLPLNDRNGREIGNVVIMTEDRLPAIIRKAHLTVTLILSVISLVSISATVLILRRVLSPVRRLKEGARKIGNGDFAHRIEVSSKDEIGSLSEVFNSMAENLQKMKEMEERLRHSERLASIGRFTAGIAHEINNPIANIIGLLKIARRDIRDEDPVSEDLDIVIKEATRCGAIVRDLLLYSRQSPPQKERVRINGLVEGAMKSVFPALNGREISFRRELDPSDPVIDADPLQLEQVFRNILTNAVQSIDGSGDIIVKTCIEGDGRISVSITDTGCGIREEDRGRIFYPFFTTKRTGEGTGLGLTVSYGIIQGHGGDISVESVEGEGSTFRITLPMADRRTG